MYHEQCLQAAENIQTPSHSPVGKTAVKKAPNVDRLKTAQKRFVDILDMICNAGECPYLADPKGEVIRVITPTGGSIQSGHGVQMQLDPGSGHIWAVLGSEEENPRVNNAPGAIVYCIPYSDALAEEIKALDKVIPIECRLMTCN